MGQHLLVVTVSWILLRGLFTRISSRVRENQWLIRSQSRDQQITIILHSRDIYWSLWDWLQPENDISLETARRYGGYNLKKHIDKMGLRKAFDCRNDDETKKKLEALVDFIREVAARSEKSLYGNQLVQFQDVFG